MEVFVVLELLPDQRRAYHFAVFLDQAALRLLREQHAGNRGHGEGIGEPSDQRQQGEDDDSGTNFFQHDGLLYFLSLRGAKRRSNPVFLCYSWSASLRSQ